MTEPTPTRYILTVPIEKIEEKFHDEHWYNDEHGRPNSTRRSLGWYIQFVGSSESIKLDDEKPTWQVGDRVRITFERIS